MAKVFYNVSYPGQGNGGAAPTVEEIAQLLGVPIAAFDADFGVVEIDPDTHLYTVLVDQQAVAAIAPQHAERVEGPYSNPGIAPFGPPAATPTPTDDHDDDDGGDALADGLPDR